MTRWTRFIRERDAQDLVEYGLIAGIIAVGAVVALTPLSNAINALFATVPPVLP